MRLRTRAQTTMSTYDGLCAVHRMCAYVCVRVRRIQITATSRRLRCRRNVASKFRFAHLAGVRFDAKWAGGRSINRSYIFVVFSFACYIRRLTCISGWVGLTDWLTTPWMDGWRHHQIDYDRSASSDTSEASEAFKMRHLHVVASPQLQKAAPKRPPSLSLTPTSMRAVVNADISPPKTAPGHVRTYSREQAWSSSSSLSTTTHATRSGTQHHQQGMIRGTSEPQLYAQKKQLPPVGVQGGNGGGDAAAVTNILMMKNGKSSSSTSNVLHAAVAPGCASPGEPGGIVEHKGAIIGQGQDERSDVAQEAKTAQPWRRSRPKSISVSDGNLFPDATELPSPVRRNSSPAVKAMA